MSKENVNRRISIYVNGKEVENSLKGVEGAISHTKNALRKLVEGSEDYEKKSAELKETMAHLKERQSQYRDELGLTTRAMEESNEMAGGLSGTLSGIWDSLLSGDLQGAKEGLSTITSGMGGLVKSAWAFIATPIGAAIAALSGIAVGTKAIFDFNIEADKSAKLLENLTGKTGQAVEDIRVRMQGMADTFELEFDNLAGAVDNLMDTGVAKNELEALDKIKNGLLTAPDKNEFISNLESSALTAKQVGMSLEDVISLKEQIEATGVDPEKTFGALQKASLNLASGSKNLRDSLTEAFGASFTDEVLAKVKTGELTTTQALDVINKKSKEVGLDQQQQAVLTKEIFGKAGLAAGGFGTIMDNVSASVKRQNQELNGNQKALLDLNTANTNLEKAQSELFRVKGFGEIWTGIKIAAIDALSSMLTWIADVKKDIQPLIDVVSFVFVAAWVLLKESAIIAFDAINIAIKLFTGNWGGAIDVVKGYFLRFGINIENVFVKIQNSVVNSIKGLVSKIAPVLDALGFDVDKIQKKLDSFKSKEVNVKTTTENGSSGGDPTGEKTNTKATAEEIAKQQAIRDAARQKEEDKRKAALAKKKAEEEKAAKEELDRALALAKAKGDLAKAELDFFIANNRSKIDSTKALTPELIAAETARLEAIKDRQLTALAEERLSKLEKAQREAKSAEELSALKQAIDLDYETKRQNLEFDFTKSTDELKKQYAEQQKQLAAEQLVADYELQLAEAQTKEDADAIKRQQDYDKQIAEYKKLLDGKKITQEEYDRFEASAKQRKADLERVAELQKVSGTLGGLNQLAGAVTELFGQSKEMAIVQAGINGAMAVTSILAQYPKFDGGFAMAAAIAAAGISTVAQIAKITKAKPPKQPNLKGFFYGGHTGNNAFLGFDEYGPMTGVVHKNEYVIPEVMTANPRYANTIAWLEHERTGRTRKFADGGETSSGVVPIGMPSGMPNPNGELEVAIRNLNSILARGITAKTVIGYEQAKSIQDLNDERNQSSENGILNS